MNLLPIITINIEPWTMIPIILVISAFLLTILGIYIGKYYIKNDKTFNKLIFIVGLLFLFMELFHEIGRFKYFGKYDWSSFPFQFCSVTMYLSLIIPFIKRKNIRSTFIMFFGLFSFLGGFLPLIFAQGNLTRWDKISGIVFSFSWHILLMTMAGVAIGYQNIGCSWKIEKKTILQTLIMFFVITCIAQVLNFTIHNFIGGYSVESDVIKEVGYIPNYELDPDSCSLFYISPYFKSNIPVIFDKIWTNLGWKFCWFIYVLAFSFGAMVVYTIIYLIKKIVLYFKKEETQFE